MGICLLLPTVVSGSGPQIIDFESPALAAGHLFDNGANLPSEASGFQWGGATFSNDFLPQFNAWRGWALSRDTSMPCEMCEEDFLDFQYSAIAGGGADGSTQFGVVFSAADSNILNPTEPAPTVQLPPHALPTSLSVTNTTYAALSMLQGDDFAKQFGGESGSEPDWFRLTIHARDAQGLLEDAGLLDPEIGIPSLASVEFLLADYTFEDDAQDYLVDTWTEIDLSPLRVAGIAGLSLRLSSSDNGFFGMNTPAYVAVDNLTFDVALPGDYNRDGLVDAIDYAVWRETLGEATLPGAAADGTLDGQVTIEDYHLWRRHFSATALPSTALPSIAAAAPEPATGMAALSVVIFLFATWRRI